MQRLRGKAFYRLGVTGRVLLPLVKRHYLSMISLSMIGAAFMLALTSSGVAQDRDRDVPTRRSPVTQPLLRAAPTPLSEQPGKPSLTYVLYSDEEQIANLRLGLEGAHSEVRTVALITGLKYAPDPGEMVFLRVTNPEEEAGARQLLDDIMARAAIEGYEFGVLDLRDAQ